MDGRSRRNPSVARARAAEKSKGATSALGGMQFHLSFDGAPSRQLYLSRGFMRDQTRARKRLAAFRLANQTFLFSNKDRLFDLYAGRSNLVDTTESCVARERIGIRNSVVGEQKDSCYKVS